MSSKHHQSLERVDEHMEQLVLATIDYLLLNARTPEQLVLTSVWIKDLRNVWTMSHKKLGSSTSSGERVWQVVNTVITAVIHYVLDRASISSHYILCREQTMFCSRLFTKVRVL